MTVKKESGGGGKAAGDDSVSSFFTDEEIEVAGIMNTLCYFVPKSEFRSPFQFSSKWAARRRRSALDSPPALPPARASVKGASPCGLEAPPEKVDATSPSTPLSFSPSESDCKSKHSKRRTSTKRTREELLGLVDRLTETRESLKGELQNVSRYYRKLKGYNSQLKSRKQELILCTMNKERKVPWEGSEGVNLTAGFTESAVSLPLTAVTIRAQQVHPRQVPFLAHQPPFTLNPTVKHEVRFPCGRAPCSIPDLNLTVEETLVNRAQPFDLSSVSVDVKMIRRALAAQARHNRYLINKMKGSNKMPRGKG
ncbi:hypothetical protein Nepgr_025637 [Nepenthes gracilis]|uniref:Uncharacterized protein n=1 Tax=Nepenthes gracilis TaxID=150966 RepID=A0AAD3T786_NEPGR|nr:hypothetical protein Nepgr_025637 [Nepenthes gracilis]